MRGVDVAEVVDDPGGEQVAQGDGAEIGMGAGEVELGVCEVEGGEGLEALGAEGGEVVEEGCDGLAGEVVLEGEAVERGEGGVGLACEDHASAGQPVGGVGVQEVAEDVDGAEGLGGWFAVQPLRGFASKECVEDGGSVRKDFDGVVELKLHGGALRSAGEIKLGNL
jgi:hypothetical protein